MLTNYFARFCQRLFWETGKCRANASPAPAEAKRGLKLISRYSVMQADALGGARLSGR